MKAEKESSEKIELRHEAIQELLGTPPNWLIRWGITVFFCVIVLLVTGSYFFRYPQVIEASAVITTERPSVWVVAQSTGSLDSIYVQNHTSVEEGQLLATIHNTAMTEDIDVLKSTLDTLQNFISEFDITRLQLTKQSLQLGDLQNDYAQLLKLLNEYKIFKEGNIYQIKITAMQHELRERRKYVKQAKAQADLYRQYYGINQKQYMRDSLLFVKNAAIVTELEQTKLQALSGKIQSGQAEQAVTNGMIAISGLEKSIEELRVEFTANEEKYRTNILVAYNQLHSLLWKWEQTYLLKASSAGIVSFSTFWGKNQTIKAGEKSFAIVPHNPGQIIGKCQIPIAGSGKVKPGQRVVIKLDEFPYMEFGVLEGVVDNVSLVSMEEVGVTGKQRFNVVEIHLPNGLVSTYQKKIPFPGEFNGKATIATQEMSLLEHFLNPIKYLIH